MSILRTILRWTIIVPSVFVGAALGIVVVASLTIIGTPIALVFSLGVCPFATIRWAFVGDEKWVDSWKRVAVYAFSGR